MYIFMFTVSLAYMYLVLHACRMIFRRFFIKSARELSNIRQEYNKMLKKQESVMKSRRKIQDEASEIFTLYDMTKRITKNFNEKDAVRIFKEILREKVFYDDCKILEAEVKSVQSAKKMKNYFITPLKGKKGNLGYMTIKGLSQEDKEKAMILIHQFALALSRIRLYNEVERLATIDSLTEVHTRRYILERFAEEIKRSISKKIKLSFLMIDVDFFKKFNDQYGHLTGDQILREITYVIRENVREIDIAGRYGGEEFCVILPDTDSDGALYVAERIRHAIEVTAISAYDTTIHATVSIGIATFPQDGKIMNELIDKADWALYRAKKLGRNRVCAFGVYEK